MKIRYSPAAVVQFKAIFQYISERDPAAAARVIKTIKRSIDRLGDFPFSACPSEVSGIRELNVVRYPYIVFYAVDERAQEVHILRVRHTSQDPEHHLD